MFEIGSHESGRDYGIAVGNTCLLYTSAPVKDLAAALKGNSGTPAEKAGAAVDEQAMKNHPLASVLQFAQGPMAVSYTHLFSSYR